jgi:hypothetical protein
MSVDRNELSSIGDDPVGLLVVHYGEDWLRGSEIVLLDLLDNLDKKLVTPIVWCNGNAMAAAVQARGYQTYRSDFKPLFESQTSFSYFVNWMRLRREGARLCEKHAIKLIHANSAASTQWVLPLALSKRLPILAHLHSVYIRYWRYVYLLHAATLIVGVSRQVLEGFVVDGVSKDCLRVIYNGIDFARERSSREHDALSLRENLAIEKNAFVVATAGSLIDRKGHDILIKAFNALPRETAPFHLIIAGEGPQRASLEALVGTLRLEQRVHFLGHVEGLHSVYKAADLFVLASRADAFPLVFIEAGHYGLASVATRVGGIPEAIEEGKTGILVPPNDVEALTNALRKLHEDPAMRASMGRAAAQRVETQLTIRKMTQQFEQTYRALLALPASRLGFLSLRKMARPYFQLFRSRCPHRK